MKRAEGRSGAVARDAQQLADAIVERLRSVTRARTLEHALEVGEIIAQGVYEGDSGEIAAHGEAHPLYRRVANHDALPFGRRRLWTCLKIYELVLRFPGLRTTSHLGVAHLRAVLNLPPSVQERLLGAAERDRLTSDRLEELASNHRRTPTNVGRPPTHAFLRGIQRIETIATQVHEELGPRVRGRLAEERAALALENLRRAREHLDRLELELQRIVSSGATPVLLAGS